jgi:hypothetical protein
MLSSWAAAVKLRARAEASKARSQFKGGSRAMADLRVGGKAVILSIAFPVWAVISAMH